LIYDTVESTKKELHWFKESGHVITLDKERKDVNQAILTFLDSLDW
ncbi:carboxylesterase, partial [Listeria innocua FSL J1-023]